MEKCVGYCTIIQDDLLRSEKVTPALRRLIFIALAFSSSLSLLYTSEENAVYNFAVRIVNNSGDPINIRKVWVKRKAGTQKECYGYDDYPTIQNGSSNVNTNCVVMKRKWQRQIQVRFFCKYYGSNYGESGALRTLYFPRGGDRYFARDHTVNNGDKYVVKIKASDC